MKNLAVEVKFFLVLLNFCRGRRRSGRNSKQRRRSITPDDVSSEASPPTRKRGKVEDSCEEEPESKRGRRGSRPRNKNENGDAEEHISKKTTRKRKMREGDGNSGYEREEKGKVGKKSKIGDRDSGELNFGRRSRNRHRGQNSEVSKVKVLAINFPEVFIYLILISI